MTPTNKLLELAAFDKTKLKYATSSYPGEWNGGTEYGAKQENARLLPLLTLMAQEIERLKGALDLTVGQLAYLPAMFPEMKDCNEPTIAIAREALAAHELAIKQMLEGK